MSDAILTYAFHALEVVAAALGVVIWWYVRRLDRVLEKVADSVTAVREQQARHEARTDALSGDVRELAGRSSQTDATVISHEARIARLETRLGGDAAWRQR